MGMANNLSSEGNYYFTWEELDESGAVSAKCGQTIFGTTLSDAASTFVAQHGGLEKDTNGQTIRITSITFTA